MRDGTSVDNHVDIGQSAIHGEKPLTPRRRAPGRKRCAGRRRSHRLVLSAADASYGGGSCRAPVGTPQVSRVRQPCPESAQDRGRTLFQSTPVEVARAVPTG